MARKKVIDKQFKLDAVQYRKDHPELTFEQVAKNLGISNSSIHNAIWLDDCIFCITLFWPFCETVE